MLSSSTAKKSFLSFFRHFSSPPPIFSHLFFLNRDSSQLRSSSNGVVSCENNAAPCFARSIMALAYDLFLSAFTAICLSFLVAKLVSLALFSGEVCGGNELSTGVDNGGGGRVEEGKVEKRLRVEGSKIKKKRIKKISSETVLVSEFKGKSEPLVVDDCKKMGSVERNFEFPESNEGLISQIEGLDQGTNQGNGAIGDQDEHQRIKNEDAGFAVSKEGVVRGNEEGEMEISDGEEWEGIERNELERDFAKAMSFVESAEKEGGLNKLGSDVIMQFYGLQKVSMEGPCHDEPQPMALKLSPRAMWNAWPKFGSMNAEEAMEKYITLLSEKVPGWMDGHSSLEGKFNSEEIGACSSSEANITCTNESKPGVELAGHSSSMKKDEE